MGMITSTIMTATTASPTLTITTARPTAKIPIQTLTTTNTPMMITMLTKAARLTSTPAMSQWQIYGVNSKNTD